MLHLIIDANYIGKNQVINQISIFFEKNKLT